MATDSANTRHLCLTICAFRNPTLTEHEYHDYMVHKQAPLVNPLMRKYGILKYTMIHNSTDTKELMGKIVDPQFAIIADYDYIVQIVFRDIEDFVRMTQDPEYWRLVVPDHENFADTKRCRMTIGYIQDFVDNIR